MSKTSGPIWIIVQSKMIDLYTTQPNIISLTTASDLTTERSSPIKKLLAQLAEKNTTLEASQTTMQAAQTTLQEQIELSLRQFDPLVNSNTALIKVLFLRPPRHQTQQTTVNSRIPPNQ